MNAQRGEVKTQKLSEQNPGGGPPTAGGEAAESQGRAGGIGNGSVRLQDP